MIGIRENESRMQALGFSTWRYKYFCFVLAGAFGGLAGALKVFQDGSIDPGSASVAVSGLGIVMVLTGGNRRFAGPVLGAGLVWIIRNIISSYTSYWGAALGIILVIIVMFSPRGIAPLLGSVCRKAARKIWKP